MTPTAITAVATRTKAVTVDKTAPITDTHLLPINVHVDFASSGRAPTGSHHETSLKMAMDWRFPVMSKQRLLDKRRFKIPTQSVPISRPMRPL